MRKILIGVIITLAIVLVFRSCSEEKEEKAILKENSMLIQQQIDHVAKLIVTEGHFAQVYNYRDSQHIFGPFLRADKKALVVVNAEVTVAYDLSNEHNAPAGSRMRKECVMLCSASAASPGSAW